MLPLSREDFDLFQRFLIETSGLYFSPDRSHSLHIALWERLCARGYGSYQEYYRFLKFHPEGRFELRELFNLITIGETYFFRNKAQFEVLMKYVLPEIVQRKRCTSNPSIRVWSAGCSGGDETYSIAIAILESIPFNEGWEISILGTDINRKELKRAKEGVYKERNIHQLPKEYLDKYFEIQGETYRLKDHVKAMVQFEYHNLASDPYIHDNMRDLDLLFCRNVIIYFDEQTTKRVIDQFYNCLSPNGYLFLGHTETLWQMTNTLERVEFPQAFIYQKRSNPIQESPLPPFVAVPNFASHNVTAMNPIFAKRRIFPEDSIAENGEKPGLLERLDESSYHEKAFDGLKEAKPECQRETLEASSFSSHFTNRNQIDIKTQLTHANLLANEARYKEAIDALLKVVELDCLNIEAYYLLGVLYYKINEFKKAETQFRKVIYLDGDSALAYYHLGNLYLFQKRLTEAAKAFGNAIRLIEKRPKDEQMQLCEDVTPDLLLRACKKNLIEISNRGVQYERAESNRILSFLDQA